MEVIQWGGHGGGERRVKEGGMHAGDGIALYDISGPEHAQWVEPKLYLGLAHNAASFCLLRVDNNLLLLLMIHVFRENEEQLFKVRNGVQSEDFLSFLQCAMNRRESVGVAASNQSDLTLWLSNNCSLCSSDVPDEYGSHGGGSAAALRPSHRLLHLFPAQR